MSWILFITEPDGRSRREKIKGFPVVIGRERTVTVPVNDPEVSRQHIKLEESGRGLVATDLGSANGTRVNGATSARAEVKAGDKIQCGGTTIVLEEATEEQVTVQEDVGERKIEVVNSLAAAPPVGNRAALLNKLAGSKISTITLEQRLNLLAHLAVSLAEVDKLEVFLASILEGVIECLPASGGTVILKEPGRATMMPFSSKVAPGCGQFAVSRTIYQQVYTTGESVLVDNALSDKRFQAGESVVASRIKAVICVPLVTRGKRVGVMYVGSQESAARFNESDLSFVAHLGSLAAVAVRLTRKDMVEA